MAHTQFQAKKILFFLCLAVLSNSQTFKVNRKLPEKLRQAAQCTAVGPNNSTIMGFGNCFQNIYYINIEIGTPPQTLGVQLDTGSNTLWVPTQYVPDVNPIFNTTISSTFKNTSRIGGVQYVDGSGVTGTFGTDYFHIQGSLINITAQYLWVTAETNMVFPAQIQGLIGMGFTNLPNFLDVAYSAGTINSSTFALQILNESMDSLIYYNQIPQSILNDTIFVPVVGNLYWQVEVTSVSVGGIDLTSAASNIAVIDSGTSYFYINNELYSNIILKFFSTCRVVQNRLTCLCSDVKNWPNFSFSFSTVEVSISASQYAAGLGNNLCTPLFGSIPGFNQILLGDIFFRKYIITFDKTNKQIGFNGQTVTPIEPIYISELANTLILVLMGSMGAICLLSFAAFICIQRALSLSEDSYKALE